MEDTNTDKHAPTPKPVTPPSPDNPKPDTAESADTKDTSSSKKQAKVVQSTPQTEQQHAQQGSSMQSKLLYFFGGLSIIILGIGSGYGLAVAQSDSVNTNGIGGATQEKGLKRSVKDAEIKVGTKVGIADESTFKDSTEGTLQKGGLDGEGSHHLKKPGGESQTVYLTSSVIDLDQFIDKKVKVWGETFSAQKAGWLMDVGKLEVLE